MRRAAALVLALLLAGPLWGALPAGVPAQPSDPVTDLAGLLSPGATASLNAALRGARDAGKAQIGVLTLPSLDGRAIEDVSIQVARAWGLGDKERGDGVLLLIAPKEHQLRIEVGSRLEGDLTDIACARVIREEMAPRLRNGDADGAVAAGCVAIAARLGFDLPGMAAATEADAGAGGGGLPGALLIVVLLPLLILLRVLGAIFGGGRRGGMGGFGGGMGGGGFGGFGGGGGGGGFGGGGGGFSGGGASGGW